MGARHFVRNASFKKKLVLFSLTLCFAPVILLGSLSSMIASRMIQEEVDLNDRVMLSQIQYQVDGFLQSLERASVQLADSLAVEKAATHGPSIRNYDLLIEMVDTVQKQRLFSEIPYDVSLVFNDYGKVYSSRYGFIAEDEFPYETITKAVRDNYGGPVVLPPNVYPNQNDLLMIRSVPLFSEKPIGFLYLHVSAGQLTKFLQQVQLEEGRKLLVLDDKGRVVLSRDPAEIGTRLYANELYRFWANPEATSGTFEMDGTDYRLSSLRSSFNGWSYIAMTETRLLTQKSRQIQMVTWLLVGALAVIWSMIALFGANRLYHPIKRLVFRFSGTSASKGELEALDSFIQHMVLTNERLKSQLDDQMPYFKETVFQRLLRGELTDAEIVEKTEQYGFPLKGKTFFVCVVDVDEYVRFRENYREKDRSLMLYALRKMIEELCGEEPSITFATAAPLPGQLAVIIGTERSGEATERTVRNLASRIQENVKRFFQITVTVALSRPAEGYRGVSEAYQQALELLSYRLLLGHGQLIAHSDIRPSVRQSRSTIVKWQKRIVSCIAQGDIEGAKRQLHETVHVVPQVVQNSETVLGLFSYLLGELDVLMQEMGIDPKTFFAEDPYKQLYAMTSLDEVTEWLTGTIIPSVAEHLASLQVSRSKRTIRQVLDYIHERYDSDLSLRQVAEQFGLSPTQLSRAFKEETNIPFGDYLLQYRMEKAKEFLVHTDMPIKDIAEKLRYTSVQNFTRVFKQTVRVPPGQYRRQYREGGTAGSEEKSG